MGEYVILPRLPEAVQRSSRSELEQHAAATRVRMEAIAKLVVVVAEQRDALGHFHVHPRADLTHVATGLIPRHDP